MSVNGIGAGYPVGYATKRTTVNTAGIGFSSRIVNTYINDQISSGSGNNRKTTDSNTAMEAFQISSVNRQLSSFSIKNVETERYTIEEKEGGYLRIYDKEHNNECVDLKLNKEKIQVDKVTGTKFIINDLGVGFFTMLIVDDELEAGLKEALGVDELDEKELTGFTVHTDQKTGIKYITANGYESRGGLLVLDKEAEQKLDSMAKEFLEQYPNLVKTYNEAWFYATFEVRGLLKRTSNGIMMISPNSISFKNKDGENEWTGIFDTNEWGIYQFIQKNEKGRSSFCRLDNGEV